MWKLDLLFLASLLIVFLLVRHEVRRYFLAKVNRQTDPTVTKKRLVRRILCSFVLVCILAMTYFGYTNKAFFIDRPWFFGIYWLSCILMAFALIVLALIDMRATFQATIKEYMNESVEEERFREFLKRTEKNNGG
ncbi:MAG: hypothetical protein RMM17_07650 [Acidobacteriota bacterium]|nr:hypothetical protein [Blastocatellia bacterium]MDW8412540.1 hypothetical protein [Acidobacteriota bacterium]